MTIIVGLGNPGEKYTSSRHNAGWRVLDAIAKIQNPNSKFQIAKPLESEVVELPQAILVKPHTFMNLSGDAVKAVMKKYAFDALGQKDFHQLFVVYDDLDLEVGKYKLVFGSGPKVHNGVNHITQVLGTDQYWHVRVGVDGRKGDRSEDPAEYVLSGFRDDEKTLFDSVVSAICDVLQNSIRTQ